MARRAAAGWLRPMPRSIRRRRLRRACRGRSRPAGRGLRSDRGVGAGLRRRAPAARGLAARRRQPPFCRRRHGLRPRGRTEPAARRLRGRGLGQARHRSRRAETESDYAFGGVYGRFDWLRTFLDFAVSVGRSRNDRERIINNNLVPGGIEVAKASFDGRFVSPEIAYGVRIPLGHFRPAAPFAPVLQNAMLGSVGAGALSRGLV